MRRPNGQQAIRLLPFAFCVACLCLSWQARADVTCTPSKPLPDQNRTVMKHRPPPKGVQPHAATIADMLAWPLPPGMKRKMRKTDSVMDPREEQAYVVEGNLWRVKLSEDDCDFHLELGPAGGRKSDERVVAEIPQGAPFLAAREALIAAIPEAGTLKPDEDAKLKANQTGRVRITGYAFCDLEHYTPKNLKQGTGHGGKRVMTLWEIHPVWKIEFLKK